MRSEKPLRSATRGAAGFVDDAFTVFASLTPASLAASRATHAQVAGRRLLVDQRAIRSEDDSLNLRIEDEPGERIFVCRVNGFRIARNPIRPRARGDRLPGRVL